jgi:hypothetical protein
LHSIAIIDVSYTLWGGMRLVDNFWAVQGGGGYVTAVIRDPGKLPSYSNLFKDSANYLLL